ncbi:MAG: hypothetical protein AAF211_24760, partial [Myxococcota bacterium]
GMFESIRLVDGKGKVKGGSCKDAVDAAMADMREKAEKKKHPTLVGVYDDRPKQGLTKYSEEVTCEVKGKNTMAKVEGLAIRSGDPASFKPITGTRVAEIGDALISEGIAIKLQLAGLDFEGYKGSTYWRTLKEREDVFGKKANRNTRAVTVFRELITPSIPGLAEYFTPVPEIGGLHVVASAKRINKKNEEVEESFHLYIPVEGASQFANGDISEQELIDAGRFMYADGSSNPVKMDISFIDAED